MEQLSIITICYNNLKDLQKTCESVDVQIMHPHEHIIIDGSSNTEIFEWLENTTQPLYRKWVCEKDKGISDAFNKGIHRSSGSLLHILNSGDVYFSNTVIKNVLNFFIHHPSTQWISGKVHMKRGGIWVNIGVPFDLKQLYKGMRSVSHPTWFVKRAVYNRVGYFSLSIKIAMDYDLMCRLKDEKYNFLNEIFVKFDDNGLSTNQYLKSLLENRRVYESHFGYSIKSRLWQFRLSLFYHTLQTKFGQFLYSIKVNQLS